MIGLLGLEDRLNPHVVADQVNDRTVEPDLMVVLYGLSGMASLTIQQRVRLKKLDSGASLQDLDRVWLNIIDDFHGGHVVVLFLSLDCLKMVCSE